MTKPIAVPGDGLIQWNFGGWFGSLLGGTIYLAVGGIASMMQQPILGVVWLSCFVIVSGAGVYLWRLRQSVSPYPAMQLLLSICAIAGTTAVLSAIFVAPNILAAVHLTPFTGVGLLSMYPAMMLYFHFIETSARRNKKLHVIASNKAK